MTDKSIAQSSRRGFLRSSLFLGGATLAAASFTKGAAATVVDTVQPTAGDKQPSSEHINQYYRTLRR